MSVNIHTDETNITNKADNNVVVVKNDEDAVLICIAKGNPVPDMMWYNPNNFKITNGSNTAKYLVENTYMYTTSADNGLYGDVITSKLTIKNVNSEMDYGVYTCNSSNGIGRKDSHELFLNKTSKFSL